MDDPGSDPAAPGADPALAVEAEGGGRRAHSQAAVLSLRQAMRRARFDDAERSGAVADLRAARLGRLDVLREALEPLIAQIPAGVECFDIGIMPGANPRLFLDMIGFVEMGRDPRVYQFLQDTRHGRVKLAESETVSVIVEAATLYVARRLLERDKALAADANRGGSETAPRSEQLLPATGDGTVAAATTTGPEAACARLRLSHRRARLHRLLLPPRIRRLGVVVELRIVKIGRAPAWSPAPISAKHNAPRLCRKPLENAVRPMSFLPPKHLR